ncbi:asparaginase [Ideonella sp.]|jgi:L-asparaginase|uniref:asparaginase n=1 Tax=Ideonella sp. TaxID=1929293 RepID=UPI0037C0DB55
MQNKAEKIVLLGTGGTIAGTSAQAGDNVGYTAGQLSVGHLISAVPALGGVPLEAEQVAQLDSKDMSHAVWQALAQRVAHHLARADVAGIVITHGTDTLEETAWFLHRVLVPTKPVVLTCAMRPASSLQPDGPQNLLDAVTVAQSPQAAGVLCVAAGQVLAAADVRKVHGYRIDAFAAGDAGPVARVEEGLVLPLRLWPQAQALGLACLMRDTAHWPRVGVVCSHAGVEPWAVEAALAAGLDGLVVEGTGNGTLHQALEASLAQAQAQGLRLMRASRCTAGGVVGEVPRALPSAGLLTPAKARVELLLQLLAAPA